MSDYEKNLPLADKELLDVYDKYIELSKQIKELEAKQAELKQKALDWLNVEGDVGAVNKEGKPIITLVTKTTTTINGKLLQVNEPEIYEKYKKVSKSQYVKFNA